MHELFFPGACFPADVGLSVRSCVPSLHLHFLFLLHCLRCILLLHINVAMNDTQACTNKHPKFGSPKRYFLFFFLPDFRVCSLYPRGLLPFLPCVRDNTSFLPNLVLVLDKVFDLGVEIRHVQKLNRSPRCVLKPGALGKSPEVST